MEGDYSVGSQFLQVVHNLTLSAMCAMRLQTSRRHDASSIQANLTK